MPTMPLDDGGVLAYDDAGGHDSPAMILVHGMGSDRSDMAPLADAFRDTYRVVTPDLPGHGDSVAEPADCGTDALAASVAALAAHLGLTDAVLVGHSLGGLVTATVAATRPELVAHLVLLDPGLAMPAEGNAGLRAFYDSLQPAGYQATLRAAMEPLLFLDTDGSALVDDVISRMARLSPELFRRFGYGVLAFDTAATLTRITAPTLFVAPQTPLAQLDEVSRLAPSWPIGRVVGTGHYMQLVTPMQVVEIIRQFLRATPRAGRAESPVSSEATSTSSGGHGTR